MEETTAEMEETTAEMEETTAEMEEKEKKSTTVDGTSVYRRTLHG